MPTASGERLRTALVGCGKVGATHAAIWKKLPMSEFVAVCGASSRKSQAFASRFEVPFYTDIAEMIEKERVRVVSICTPHPWHEANIRTAVDRGAHVICEKPLTVDLPSCDRAIAAARSAGVKLGVISQRRFYEPVRRMKDAIDAGKIGKPVLANVVVLGWRDEAYYRSDPWRGTWKGEGGGVMVSQCTHQLDLLLWLMGPLKELSGYWDNFNHPYIEVEDTVAAIMRFEGGAIASLVLSNSQCPGLFGRVHVHGSSGASVGVQVESGSPFIAGVTERVEPAFNDIWTIPGEEHFLETWKQQDESLPWDAMTHYHELQLEDFLCAVLEDREPLVNGEAGRRVVELFTAVYQSQRDRKPVQFPLSS